VADLGSGRNSHENGLKRLLNDNLSDRTGRLTVTHTDRWLRWGAALVFAMCEAQPVDAGILNPGEDTTWEEAWAQDVREIITGFSARLDGSRSRHHHKLLAGVKHAVQETPS
jgi:predicted site-specific integrase-resolvase